MGVTFSLGSASFGELSTSSGRKAMSIRVSAPEHEVKRFHPPGTTGNLLIFDGKIGQRIAAHCRYVETLSSAISAFASDRTSWVGAPISITDDGGSTYDRCTLTDASRISDPVAIGRGGLVYFDVLATFTVDS